MANVLQNVRTTLSGLSTSNIINGAAAESLNRARLFRSARLKLTGFYLLVLIIFSLTLTLSLRSLASHTFDMAGAGDRGVVRRLFDNFYSVPPQPNTFNQFQTNQSADVHHDLDEDTVIINVIAVIVGGVVSYWYAGRTLRPIEKAHEAQARFAADASHELRTPLAALKVENEVFLHQKSFKPAEAKELIKSNLEGVGRLENLAGNLLALTQYENVDLELVVLDVGSVVDAAIDHARKALDAKKITLQKTVPPATVEGQFDSLVQLLGIIIDNAAKYSSAGSTIFIDGIKDGHNYHISVRDEGPGIAEADLPHIFERLYRGDKSRTGQTGGYGLGLALAREIASANRAAITARNYPSGGAQLVVTLRTN